VAAMEYRGTPVDSDMYYRLNEYWELLKVALIAQVAKEFSVFEGTTFKMDRFEALLQERGVAWPRTESGRPALDVETFRQQVRVHPWLAPIREARNNSVSCDSLHCMLV